VTKYNQFLVKVIEQERLIPKLQEITTADHSGNGGNAETHLKQLDQQWIQAKIEAE